MPSCETRAPGPKAALFPADDCVERGRTLKGHSMEETVIDQAAMGRLAKVLVFICGKDHPTTVALQLAAETGSERDIKNARALFIKLKPGDRRAALPMLNG
jgi:hypothetical protein